MTERDLIWEWIVEESTRIIQNDNPDLFEIFGPILHRMKPEILDAIEAGDFVKIDELQQELTKEAVRTVFQNRRTNPAIN